MASLIGSLHYGGGFGVTTHYWISHSSDRLPTTCLLARSKKRKTKALADHEFDEQLMGPHTTLPPESPLSHHLEFHLR